MHARLLPFALAIACASPAAQATEFPSKEITFVIPTGAGGATDVASRMVATAMAQQLKVPFVAVNKSGAGGMIGPAYIAQQPPDGYRIGVLLTSATELAPYISSVPFKLDDLAFVASVASYRFGLIVDAKSPYRTVDDLIQASRGPGTFFGASSITPGLGITKLGKLTGATFELVNYRSGSETLTELIGGRVQSAISQPADVIPHVQAGTLRLLASPGTQRWPQYPDVPTLKELGYDVALVSEIAIVAPAGTPAAVLARLQEAAFAATEDPKFRAELDRLGMDPVRKSGAQTRQMIRDNFLAAAPAMKDLNKEWVPKACFVDCGGARR
ncbi:tripartite tricarboxylate transporter substrate binding protein [Bordetella hinzii]|nr:tripartite tricarboxylate transporter substrate binding protein [Bordetella hinzii]